MGRFFAFSVLLAFAGLTVVSCQVQFPCDHFLRIFLSWSSLFQHCQCRYENSMDVIPMAGPPISVPRSECESGVKIPGILQQHGVSCNATGCDECPDRNVSVFVCKTDCRYVNSWDMIEIENATSIRVPRNQCRSEYAFPAAKQYLVADGGFECNETWCSQCENKWIIRYICEPTLAERLIMTFDISGTGQDTTSILPDSTPQRPTPPPITGVVCDLLSFTAAVHEDHCATRQICAQNGRRSILPDYVETEEVNTQREEPQPLPVDPLPFDYTKHHTRYRRQARSSNCEDPNSERHVLFMLDTSGSIGLDNFNNMTNSISKLVHYFCRKIKVAMVVFNQYRYLEFCFECFDNDCDGRLAARDKIRRIPYRGGYTFTASATQCACNKVLTSGCGFEPTFFNRACLDVIYITDGRSNDPLLQVCDVVECLYNKPDTDVTVYAFGIGNNVNDAELNCITRSQSNGNVIFKVRDFQSFSDAVDQLEGLFSDPENLPVLSQHGSSCFSSNPNNPDGLGGDNCQRN